MLNPSLSGLYSEAMARLESWKTVRRNFRVCPVCGYIVTKMKEAQCPVCSTPKKKFLKINGSSLPS
ncbi:MAG: hypothetical protein NC930_08170 [Candidatus Omnitrophica bacterium]|nr:hypothetical protein [Candidatus Omnitrophota bacterium]